MAKATKSEQKKRLALAVLGGLLVVVVAYQFLLSSPPKTTRKATSDNAAAGPAQNTGGSSSAESSQASKKKGAAPTDEIAMALMQDLTPLNLEGSPAGGSAEPDKVRGNIFEFWKEPPPPPPPPARVPPIQLSGVNPASAVAGTPRKLTLTIFGTKIPEDAQVYCDNNPKPTRRVGENQLAIDLEPGEYSYARSISIGVKSKSDPAHMDSNAVSFNVQAAPEPQFRYIGRLGDQGVFDLPATREIKRLSRGDMIGGQWRIDSISDQGVDVTLAQYDIKKHVALQDKTR